MAEQQINAKRELMEKEIQDAYHLHLPTCNSDSNDFLFGIMNSVQKARTMRPKSSLSVFALTMLIIFSHEYDYTSIEDILIEFEKIKNMTSTLVRDSGKPMGLVNVHNTCYLNVLLQCLYNSIPFHLLM